MSRDRIQIDGVWYVREKEEPLVKIKEEDVSNYLSCCWESANWYFKASSILKDDAKTLNDVYRDIDIEILNKKSPNRERTHSDNPNWFWGVLEGNPESMESADEVFDEVGLREFKAFLNYLIEKNWLKK
jgi:hypothetical protein